MAKEILYTTALDKNGSLIHLDEAEKSRTYYCPECKDEFILRRSGKTGKGTKRPHFAHNYLTTNCTPEGVLHYSFKKRLISLLERYKEENKALEVNWNCDTCSKKNNGNLLERASSIREEYNLKLCQPDIAILDAEENVIAVIEIVVTHKPEESALQYYEQNKIVLIQINLSSEEDLKDIERKIRNPDIVNYCLNPKCQNYSKYSIIRRILRLRDQCGSCLGPIEKFFIEINSVFGKQPSLDFSEDEIRHVKSKHRNIRVVINESNNEKYPTSTCLNCKRMKMRYGGGRRF